MTWWYRLNDNLERFIFKENSDNLTWQWMTIKYALLTLAILLGAILNFWWEDKRRKR